MSYFLPLGKTVTERLFFYSFVVTNKKKHSLKNLNQLNMENILSRPAIGRNTGITMNTPQTGTQAAVAAVNNRSIIIPQSQLHLSTMAEMMAANQFPLQNSITVQVASATGVGAVTTKVYLFNQSRLNNVTNNGSGAGTITYTYQDGFGGTIVDDVLTFARGGVGAVCRGVALRMITTATDAGNAAALSTANPSFITYNMLGGSTSMNFNITANQTRGDFDTSIEVIPCTQNIGRFVQYSFAIPAGVTATATFYFDSI